MMLPTEKAAILMRQGYWLTANGFTITGMMFRLRAQRMQPPAEVRHIKNGGLFKS